MSNGTLNGTVISYCPTCKQATTHLITKRGPLCKTCLAKNSRGYIAEKLQKVSFDAECVICQNEGLRDGDRHVHVYAGQE